MDPMSSSTRDCISIQLCVFQVKRHWPIKSEDDDPAFDWARNWSRALIQPIDATASAECPAAPEPPSKQASKKENFSTVASRWCCSWRVLQTMCEQKEQHWQVLVLLLCCLWAIYNSRVELDQGLPLRIVNLPLQLQLPVLMLTHRLKDLVFSNYTMILASVCAAFLCILSLICVIMHL